ncbi:MAG: hypothetical protein EOL95_05715 [Bacteroidia bacterium]|nr:hypothetical protein [Bacteroidia bacterium]
MSINYSQIKSTDQIDRERRSLIRRIDQQKLAIDNSFGVAKARFADNFSVFGIIKNISKSFLSFKSTSSQMISAIGIGYKIASSLYKRYKGKKASI